MRRTVLTLMALTVGLAACNDQPGNKGDPIGATDAMTGAQVKAQVDKVQLKPGQWQGRYTVQDIDMPQAPADMKDRIKRAMSQAMLTYCITPEQAANPSGAMFAGQENKDCTYSGFEAKDGKVKGQLTCKAQNGTMTAAMSGTYAPETYAMDMDMKMAGGAEGTTMAISARSEGQWTGPTCGKAP